MLQIVCICWSHHVPQIIELLTYTRSEMGACHPYNINALGRTESLSRILSARKDLLKHHLL